MPDPKASILIVEDEEPVRTSLAEILTVLGHRVRCAADGLAALVEMNRRGSRNSAFRPQHAGHVWV